MGSLKLELQLVVRLFSHIIILRPLLETNRSRIVSFSLGSILQKGKMSILFPLPNWVTLMSK